MVQIDFNELNELETNVCPYKMIFAEMVSHLYFHTFNKDIHKEIERLYRSNYNQERSYGVVADMLKEIRETILSEIRYKCFNTPKGLTVASSNVYIMLDDWIYCDGKDWDTKHNWIWVSWEKNDSKKNEPNREAKAIRLIFK